MQIERHTGFNGLRKALSMNPDELIELIKNSGLTGRGGAHFPTWKKLSLARSSQGEKIVVCDAEESEPGTFKDRFILEKNPLIVVEGIAIASHIIEARQAIIYLRGEYSFLEEGIRKAIEEYNKLFGDINIHLVISGGGYICGEETAILNSLEGKRPNPRNKPPFPVEKGYMDKPTLVNNVETLAMLPLIILGDYAPDLRLFSISGNVEKPGVYEARLGITLGELIARAKPIGNPRAVLLGASGGVLRYDPNLVLTMDNIERLGGMLGMNTLIIINDEQDLLQVFKHIAEFFVHESCGLCTPCREGNPRIVDIMEKIIDGTATSRDISLLERLAKYIADTSMCGLGKASTKWLLTALKYFPEVFSNAKSNN